MSHNLASCDYFGVMQPLFLLVTKRFSLSCIIFLRLFGEPHQFVHVVSCQHVLRLQHSTPHEVLQVFIKVCYSCLHAELLFVLRIVTAVSIARTGCSIC